MFPLDIYFLNNEVYVGKKRKLRCNEILTYLLNQDFSDLSGAREELMSLSRRLLLDEGMDYENVERYDAHAKKAQRIMNRLDSIAEKIPLYRGSVPTSEFHRNRLTEALSRLDIWEEDYDELDTMPEWEQEALYPRYYKPTISYLTDDAEMIRAIEEGNRRISETFQRYLTFTDDLLRVKNVYLPFLEKWMHGRRRFLTGQEMADAYGEYLKQYQHGPGDSPFGSAESRTTFEIILDENGKNVLCRAHRINTLGVFLYYDFFQGIGRNYIPSRCRNCGKFFLLTAGKYSEYCETPLAGDPAKTCRDIGARKRYDDKCRNDPVWLTYNRAYKAHYARYMKKKMTAAEFERWSRYAVELRSKAESGELEFEEYLNEIKK